MEYNLVTSLESCLFDAAPTFLIFAKGAPQLLYYSHIPAAIISLLVGFFVYFKNKTLAGRLLLFLSIIFSFWVFISLIVWTNLDSRIIMVLWSFFGILYSLIYVLSLYFVYVFIDKRDISFIKKIILGAILLPVVAFSFTRYGTESFNLTNCEAVENNLYTNYYYFLGLAVFVWILALVFNRYRKTEEREVRKQIVYLAVGIEFFLLSFFTAGLLNDYLVVKGLVVNYNIEYYSLFGMTFFMGMLAYLIVKFKAFNIKFFKNINSVNPI